MVKTNSPFLLLVLVERVGIFADFGFFMGAHSKDHYIQRLYEYKITLLYVYGTLNMLYI